MSSPLPNALLVQRLDTLLGVSLAKYTSIARGDANFDALLAPEKTSPADGQTPKRQAQDQTDTALRDGRRLRQSRSTDTLISTNKQRPTQQVDSFPSSPTTLGPAARLVLSLLQSYPLTPSLVLRSPMAEASALAQLGSAVNPTSSSVPTPATPFLAPASTAHASGAAPTGATPVAHAAAPNPPSGAASSPPLQTTITPTTSSTAGTWPNASQPAITQLAQMLAQQVQTSGMFYEATLARVAFQGASAQLLQQHPQAMLQTRSTNAIHNRETANTPPTSPNAQDSIELASAAGSRLTVSTLATEQALLVRQQLEVLATQQWQAQTQAWPGVPVLWTIERMASEPLAPEQNPHKNNQSSADDSEAPWQTRLTLQLPQIGTVEACLQFKGDHCQLSLYCPQSADILRQHAPALQAQFAGSSVSLRSLDIYDHLAALPQQAASAEDGARR